ncbi:MAG: hypothetical protein HY317_05505 [Acidobacteria bacterium]|nr:hypothetical protein [Acidobacteriota bacterium]
MEASREDRIRNLRTEGWTLLDAGRSREAADAFGRVVLQDPADAEARRGLDDARAAVAEEARLLDQLLDQAIRATDTGDRGQARQLLEDVIVRGGDRDRALALLDRLEDHVGRVEARPPAGEAAASSPVPAARRARSRSRRIFAVAWACLFALLAAGIAVSWERLLENLVRTPGPRSQAGDRR